MPESDRPLDLLYAVRDVGVAPLRVDAVRAHVETAVRREIELEISGPNPPGADASRHDRRPTFGALVTAVSMVITIAIAATAITLLAHAPGRTRSGAPAPGQLIAKLAVLSSPQTKADMLRGRLHIRNPQGTIIPRLTRLVRTLPDARLFLVVTTPNTRSNPIWSPRLGDQVAIVEVSGSHATETMPIPAADLTNANEVDYISLDGQQSPNAPGAYYVGIAPDGVARARWTFANNQFQPGAILDASVADNVAVARARADTPPPVLRGAWYAPDGRRVATSDRALLAARTHHDAGQKSQAIRFDLRHAHRADSSLLRAFAVFAIASRTGVKTAAGDVISHLPLSSLPLDVVQSGIWIHVPVQLDPTQARQIITPSGARLYVIPGRRGLCLLDGSGGGSCDLLPGVQTRGLTMTVGSLGASTTDTIVPKTIHTITVRTARGTRTIPVPDGIYVSPSQRPHESPLPPCPRGVAPCKLRSARHP